MMRQSIPIIFVLLFGFYLLDSLLLVSCAQVVNPEGGPRDTVPPVLDSAKSTLNYQTNFSKQTIELAFDEFIELRDVFTQVVVSPPLATNLDVSLVRYKTVEVKFAEDEVLRENATYTINFGQAIKDFTAGNVNEFRFVFSTGPYIDSLEVTGKLLDAYTGSPVEDVLLMLYDNLADTVVRTERPFYFARTDQNGQFKIQNVKSDTFKVFALEDSNLNYLFDQASERIGFLDSTVILTDSTPVNVSLLFFQEETALRLINDQADNYGIAKLVFNTEAKDADIWYDDFGQYTWLDYDGDTLRFWYDMASADPFNIYIMQDTILDTVTVSSELKGDFLANQKTLKMREAVPSVQHNPSKALELNWRFPLKSWDTSRIQLMVDSTKTPVIPKLAIDSTDQRKLLFLPPWKEGKPYELVLLPGAITDVYGLENDTIRGSWRTALAKDFGKLSITIKGLDSTQQYIVELLGRNDVFIDRFTIENLSSDTRSFPSLPPGDYGVRIVADRNRNGRWDPGNYDRKEQPEDIFQQTLESLKANWEVESSVQIDQIRRQ